MSFNVSTVKFEKYNLEGINTLEGNSFERVPSEIIALIASFLIGERNEFQNILNFSLTCKIFSVIQPSKLIVNLLSSKDKIAKQGLSHFSQKQLTKFIQFVPKEQAIDLMLVKDLNSTCYFTEFSFLCYVISFNRLDILESILSSYPFSLNAIGNTLRSIIDKIKSSTEASQIQKTNINALKLILKIEKRNPNIELSKVDYQTLFQIKDEELLELIVRHPGFSRNSESIFQSFFYDSIEENQKSTVKILLDSKKVDSSTDDYKALKIARDCEHIEVAKELIYHRHTHLTPLIKKIKLIIPKYLTFSLAVSLVSIASSVKVLNLKVTDLLKIGTWIQIAQSFKTLSITLIALQALFFTIEMGLAAADHLHHMMLTVNFISRNRFSSPSV